MGSGSALIRTQEHSDHARKDARHHAPDVCVGVICGKAFQQEDQLPVISQCGHPTESCLIERENCGPADSGIGMDGQRGAATIPSGHATRR
jgi:hypothetical protein